MRSISRGTAEQLASIAVRYRSPLRRNALRGDRGSRPFGGYLFHGWQRTMSPNNIARATNGAESSDLGDEMARRGRLEAVLFLSKEPLNTRKLAQLANLVDGTDARTLARQLNGVYDQTGRAFRIEEIAGGLQLRTRPQFAPWLRRMGHVPQEMRLSAPAMETLAVVAYRQPALRADIEAVRGVSCGEILRQLMDRELVRVAGRSDELGRPYLYGTTRQFLQLFGLRSLDELPRATLFREPLVDNSSEQSQAGHDSKINVGPLHEGVSDVNATVEKKNLKHPGNETDEERPRSDDVRAAQKWDDDEIEDDELDDDDDWDDDDDEDEDLDDEDELDEEEDEEIEDDEGWVAVGDDEVEDDDEWEYEYDDDDEEEDDEDDEELDEDEEWVEVDDDEEEDDDWDYEDDDEDDDDDDDDEWEYEDD